MELETASVIAERVKAKLTPFCERIEIAGSIRRGKYFVRDIDIVAIPSSQGQFLYALQQLGNGVPLPMGRAVAKAVRKARGKS